MKKKLLLIPVIFIMLISLGGCTRGFSFQLGAIENNSSHKMSSSYSLLTGTKVKDITVKEGEPVTVSADITTKKGSLDVFIINEKDEYSYEGHDLQTQSFTVTLSDPGKYTIKISAKKHNGGYTFQW